jgi:hypothetical protein
MVIFVLFQKVLRWGTAGLEVVGDRARRQRVEVARTWVMVMKKTLWEREDPSFIPVAATALHGKVTRALLVTRPATHFVPFMLNQASAIDASFMYAARGH